MIKEALEKLLAENLGCRRRGRFPELRLAGLAMSGN
jgi:hypothetical protein